jgi:hypothetical protein
MSFAFILAFETLHQKKNRNLVTISDFGQAKKGYINQECSSDLPLQVQHQDAQQR